MPIFISAILSRSIGVQDYGVYAFQVSLMIYVQQISEWGLNYHGAVKISDEKSYNKKSKMAKKLSLAKLLIGILLIAGTLIFELFYYGSSENFELFLPAALIVLGSALGQQYAYYALDISHKYNETVLKTRIGSGIFIIIMSALDLLSSLVALYIYAATLLLIGYFTRCYKTKFVLSTAELRGAFVLIKDGVANFLGGFAPTLYTITPVILIGTMIGDREVAAFYVLYSIVKSVQALSTPCAQYYFSKTIMKDLRFSQTSIKQQVLMQFSISMVLTVVMLLLSKPVVGLLYGKYYLDHVSIIYCLSPIIALGSMSSLIGTNFLIANGLAKNLAIITGFGGLLSIAFQYLFTSIFSLEGMMFALVITELFIFIAMVFSVKHLNEKKYQLNI